MTSRCFSLDLTVNRSSDRPQHSLLALSSVTVQKNIQTTTTYQQLCGFSVPLQILLVSQCLYSSPTFSADEAPADVDVFVVLNAPARNKVVGADDAVVGEDDAARRHAQVCGVIGYRTANAPHQTT